MKILAIHSDFIEFEPKEKAIEFAEECELKKKRIEECLVVFVAVEKDDERDLKKIAEALSEEVSKIAKEIKTKRIVLYPYAHLSRDLSSPEAAIEILKESENILKSKFEVYRAPFGWYKSFEIKCKGHPLSELSREIKIGEISEALKKEKKLVSQWFIIEPNGKMNKIEIENGKIFGFDFSEFKNLEKFAKYEMAKSRKVEKEPPHIKLMKKLEIADYEPASDPGNLRFLPKGRLIKSLIERFVTKKMKEYGAMEVETPIMYDFEHPALKDYLNRFPARQYVIQTPNKKVFLRFAACFGQFLLAKDATISYKNLPLKIYELTRYSFRVEQRGELAGLRRLRAFTMPDCHALCKDLEQAKEEIIRRFELSTEIQKSFGLTKNDLELAIRVTKDFYEENKDFIKELVKKWDKPALLEMWDKQFFYFVFKYEFNFVDALDKAAALTTDQIDVENAKRYGIKFIDSDGEKKFPIILHLSPSGAVERVIYAILEKEAMNKENGLNPMLPLWLSPTQIRICPVSKKFISYSEEIAKEIEKNEIRVDIDDREETIPKKIRDAETEWIPVILVIGEKEIEGKEISVRIRDRKKSIVKRMSLDELVEFIKSEKKDYPFETLAMNKYLSKRPIFYS